LQENSARAAERSSLDNAFNGDDPYIEVFPSPQSKSDVSDVDHLKRVAELG